MAGGARPVQTVNAYLAGLAQRRRLSGRAATAVAWDDKTVYGAGTGKPMDPDARWMRSRTWWTRVTSDALIAGIHWDQPESVLALTRAGSLFVDLPEFRRMRAHHEQAEKDHSSLRSELAVMSPEDQERALAELIRSEIAAVLRYDSVDDVEPSTPFLDLGLDSISGLRIRKRLAACNGSRSVGAHGDRPPPTTDELAGYLQGSAGRGTRPDGHDAP